VLRCGPLALDRATRDVRMHGQLVELTFTQFELVSALMQQPERVFSREELLRAIWGEEAYRQPRGIDVHVRHLREKLEDVPERPRMLLTVRGGGYRIHAP
jgi:DNA-binding response OmpR family regulator